MRRLPQCVHADLGVFLWARYIPISKELPVQEFWKRRDFARVRFGWSPFRFGFYSLKSTMQAASECHRFFLLFPLCSRQTDCIATACTSQRSLERRIRKDLISNSTGCRKVSDVLKIPLLSRRQKICIIITLFTAHPLFLFRVRKFSVRVWRSKCVRIFIAGYVWRKNKFKTHF